MASAIRLAGLALVLSMAAMPAQGQAQAQDAPELEEVFTITAEIADVVDVGETIRGPRRLIPITGGVVEGQAISGRVLPGAWDWQIVRPDGCTDLEADYFIETNDGALINVLNHATICPPEENADGSDIPAPIYTRPKFEPPMGAHQWLGREVFVGRLEMPTDYPGRAVRIRVFRVR